MGEILGALAELLGVYLLHALGRLVIFLGTLGYFRAAPYDDESNANDMDRRSGRVVSRTATMFIGFIVLLLMVIAAAIYFSPGSAP